MMGDMQGKTRKQVPLIRESAHEVLARNARCWPEETAFIFDDECFTWKECETITERIARSLLGRGFGRGDHIGFWSMNTAQMVHYLLAVWRIGGVAVAINYSYKARELRDVLRRAHVRALLLGEDKPGSDFAAMVRQVRDECPYLTTVMRMEQTVSGFKSAWLRSPGEKDGYSPAGGQLEAAQKAVRAEDPMVITFTSGTTRLPKAAVLSYINVLNNARQFAACMGVGREAGDVLLAPLPLFHCSGMTGMLAFGLTAAIPTVIERSFKAEEAMELIERHQVSVLMAVPSMLEMLAFHPRREEYDISSLRTGQTSGAGMTPARKQQVLSLLGFERFCMAYGQTECAPLITATRYEDGWDKIWNTSGRALDHVSLRIWDLEHDRQADPGQAGEIQVRGFNTMIGYYDAPQENAEKFTDDGWLKTTDAGWLDADGYLHFTTRLSEVIIRHGENISPLELESVAEEFSERILQVKAVGVPSSLAGEEIALLVRTDGADIGPDALREYFRSRLAGFKVPRFVFQVEAFPMTQTGKIDVPAARELAIRLAEEKATTP